jgi:hypothetical protein
MTSRRLGVIVVACIVLGIVLTLGLQRLTSGGDAIPTESAAHVDGSASPGATRSTIGLPDPVRTPGAINPAPTQDNLATTVCKPGWATSVRPPAAYTSALKLVQIVEYGYADRNPSHYQEDHLVPLELGGAPRDRRNLWPEPNTVTLAGGISVGSKEKDDLEDELHAEVCAGTLSLADAQRSIASDWIAAWEAAGKP